jgi:WD40 repeat protein
MAACRYLVTVGLFIALLISGPAAAPQYSDWSPALNLGALVNSAFNDAGPAVSKNGLSLYFGSDRPGGFGGFDLWVSQRASVDAPWGPPANLGVSMNTGANENVPILSRDQHWVFFNSTRSGGFGGADLWASYREHIKDDFGWQLPVNLGGAINSSFQDQGAGYLENGDGGMPLLFFNSDRPGGMGAADIYSSPLLPDGSFGSPTPVLELNSSSQDQRASVRFDGLEVVFFSNRAGTLGGLDLWEATRQTVFDAWSTPLNLGPLVNTAANDQQPHLGADRQTLYFMSDRAGGFGAQDLYLATRIRRQP